MGNKAQMAKSNSSLNITKLSAWDKILASEVDTQLAKQVSLIKARVSYLEGMWTDLMTLKSELFSEDRIGGMTDRNLIELFKVYFAASETLRNGIRDDMAQIMPILLEMKERIGDIDTEIIDVECEITPEEKLNALKVIAEMEYEIKKKSEELDEV